MTRTDELQRLHAGRVAVMTAASVHGHVPLEVRLPTTPSPGGIGRRHRDGADGVQPFRLGTAVSGQGMEAVEGGRVATISSRLYEGAPLRRPRGTRGILDSPATERLRWRKGAPAGMPKLLQRLIADWSARGNCGYCSMCAPARTAGSGTFFRALRCSSPWGGRRR